MHASNHLSRSHTSDLVSLKGGQSRIPGGRGGCAGFGTLVTFYKIEENIFQGYILDKVTARSSPCKGFGKGL
jgi:hypothetical protein